MESSARHLSPKIKIEMDGSDLVVPPRRVKGINPSILRVKPIYNLEVHLLENHLYQLFEHAKYFHLFENHLYQLFEHAKYLYFE